MTYDELHTLRFELSRRDPRFLRILSINPAEGQGTNELRSATTGRLARQTFTFEGERILTPRFDDAVKARFTAAAEAAPDPYAAGIAKLKAAASASASQFKEEWKAARRRDLEAEYARSKQ